MINVRRIILISLITILFNTNSYASLSLPLESIDGSKHSLSEYIGHGQWIVLNIWGTDCPPCKEEVPELVNFHDEHHKHDSMVVSIAIDFPSFAYANKKEVIQFAEDHLIDFPIFLNDASVTEKLGLGRLDGLPTTYIYDPEGTLVAKQVGGVTKKIIEDFIQKQKLLSTGSNSSGTTKQ